MEQRNLLLAIVLSVAILIGFQYLFEKIRPAAPPPPPVATQTTPTQTATEPRTGAPAATGTAPEKQRSETASEPRAALGSCTSTPGAEGREVAIAEQARIKINTPRLHGSISLKGGCIDD